MGCSQSAPAIQYTVDVPGSQKPGGSAIKRHIGSPDTLISAANPNVLTLFDNLRWSVKSHPDNPFLGTRSVDATGAPGNYEWVSYQEGLKRCENLGRGMVAKELIVPMESAPADPNDTSGDNMLGLFSANRAEWILAEHAAFSFSCVTVPLYDTLGPDAVRFIVEHTRMKTVVVSRSKLPVLVEGCKDTQLRNIVLMEAKTDDENATVEAAGMKLYSVAELETEGAAHPELSVKPPTPSMLATICFTSGTTGNPKGAMLTHANIIADAAGAIASGVSLNATDVHISYLPLAHMFERMVQVVCMYQAVAIGFFRGDILGLFDDIGVLCPTLFPSVPRLFNRLYDKVIDGANKAGGLKLKLFRRALSTKVKNLQNGRNTHWLWDALVFKKLRLRLGGRVRLMITGSAPISSDVLNFLRAGFSCPVVEGYGQTESSAAATVGFENDMTVGHVGGPLQCNEIILMDVEDMNYTSSGEVQQGEVCFRGPNVFCGYFKDAEKTAEALDSDGWLHSGDIGQWLPNGSLKIIDRKKNIFKLSQGEYVAAEKIENVYTSCPLVAQAFVYGDSLKSCLVAILVPDPEAAKDWATSHEGMADKTLAQLCNEADFEAAVSAQLKDAGKVAKLRGFEVVKAIHLEPNMFSVENNMLTPTFKLRRQPARDHYREQIDAMYAKLN